MTDEEKAAAAAAEKAAAEKAAAEAAAAKEAEGKETDEERQAREAKEAKEAEDATLLKDVMKWKEKAKTAEAAAEAARKAKEETEAKYTGIDPEKAREALTLAEKAELKKLEDKGEYERILAQVNEKNQTALGEKDKALSEKDAEIAALKNQINGLTIGNSFGSSTFIEEQLVLTPNKVEALYGGHFEVEDGGMVAYDKPRGATERTKLVDDKGQPLTFESAIEKIVSSDPDFERMKKSKMKPGAGSKTAEEIAAEKADDDKNLSGLDRIRRGLAGKK